MRKILVTGSTGLVGSKFVGLHPAKEELLTPSHQDLDITSNKAVQRYIEKHKPEIIINFAAYTNVGEAENQRGEGSRNSPSWQLNVEGVLNILSAISGTDVALIQISTDMVFPGSEEFPGPYSEDAAAERDEKKLTFYGYTKAEAEREILNSLGNKATILRIIYPVSAKYDRKLDYLRKPLQLFDEGKLYPMFTDQQISIAFVDEVASALEKIMAEGHKGIFHATSSDTTTPHELISYLIQRVRGKSEVVQKNSLAEFLKKVDNPVRYPIYGGLKVESTEEKLGIRFRTWRKIVDELISQGLGK